MKMITPFGDYLYLLKNVILGAEPAIEDFILLVGTIVAFIAFILWCCFPIDHKNSRRYRRYDAKNYQIKYSQHNLSFAPHTNEDRFRASGLSN